MAGVTGTSVTDPIPADLISDTWTATGTGGASGYSPTGTGSIANTVTLPAGSSITYVVTGTVSPTATGTLTNTATVTPPVGTAKSATDVDNIVLPANLTITKVDNAGGSSITPSIGNVSPGQSLVYTIVVGNSGPGNANGAKITDPIPADLTGDTWTASQTGGASGFLTTGSGNISQSGVNLPAGSTITYTVTGTVSATANGPFTNTATVAPPHWHRQIRGRYRQCRSARPDDHQGR